MSLLLGRGFAPGLPARTGATVLLAAILFAPAGAAAPPAAVIAELQQAKTAAVAAPRAVSQPRSAYLAMPAFGEVKLAADGRHLAFHQRRGDNVDVLLQDLDSGRRVRVAAGLQGVETAWSGDGQRLWLADKQGLAVIDSATASARRVLKWDSRRGQRLWAVDARAPRHAIVHETLKDAGGERHRYLAIDASGASRLLLETALPLRSALLDAGGRLVYSAGFEGARYDTVIRQHHADGSRELRHCTALEDCRLVGYSETQGALWLLAPEGGDRQALHRWRQANGRWEVVHRDPAATADADTLLWSAAREDWRAIAYHGARRHWHGNDDASRAVLATLERRLAPANLQLSASGDGRRWLVSAQQAASASERYFLFEPASGRLQPLLTDLAGNTAPPGVAMHALSYRASDGMPLHGYLLLPAGIAAERAPLVAWLHGGPIARIFDRYDPRLQLLANRGYAVFVPNFRASTGYGLGYTLAAQGEVGKGRVLADVIDGLDFLLAQGIGDRDRQAVMGLSFGGYASLLAASHHPRRFRLAFAGVPPTDYGWTKQWQAEHDSQALRADGPPLALQFPLLGFRYLDPAWRQRMRAESPLAMLPALQTPVYLWAGAQDDRVPLKSVVHYAGEARRLHKPISLLIDPEAGHGPDDSLSADACLYLLERAAHRHLGGVLSPPSAELQAFLRRNLRIDDAP